MNPKWQRQRKYGSPWFLEAAWSSPTTRFQIASSSSDSNHYPQLLTSSLTRGFIYCPNAHARIWLVGITLSDWLTFELWTWTSVQDFPHNLDFVLVLGLCTRTCPNFGHHMFLGDRGGPWTLNSATPTSDHCCFSVRILDGHCFHLSISLSTLLSAFRPCPNFGQ